MSPQAEAAAPAIWIQTSCFCFFVCLHQRMPWRAAGLNLRSFLNDFSLLSTSESLGGALGRSFPEDPAWTASHHGEEGDHRQADPATTWLSGALSLSTAGSVRAKLPLGAGTHSLNTCLTCVNEAVRSWMISSIIISISLLLTFLALRC